MIGDLSKNWWVVVLRGVLAILFGVVGFTTPALTLAALVLLFGAWALADGILALVAAVRGQGGARWWALSLKGIVGIAAGLITFFWPGITALGLLFLVAAWAIVSGAMEIATAIRLRKRIEHEWLLALAGVASVVFGVLLAAAPGAGALALIWIIATYAIVFGILLVVLGIRLRVVHRGLADFGEGPISTQHPLPH